MSSNVWEAAGVYASEGTNKGWAVAKEVKGGIALEVDFRLVLTTDAARRFADQIYRMAEHSDDLEKHNAK